MVNCQLSNVQLPSVNQVSVVQSGGGRFVNTESAFLGMTMMLLVMTLMLMMLMMVIYDEDAVEDDEDGDADDDDADEEDDDADLDIVDTASLKSAKEISIKDQGRDQSLQMFVYILYFVKSSSFCIVIIILYNTTAFINIPFNIPSNICFRTESELSTKSEGNQSRRCLFSRPQFLINIKIIIIANITIIIMMVMSSTSFLSARFGTFLKLLKPRSRKEVLIPTWV